jgi:hypothetical protein
VLSLSLNGRDKDKQIQVTFPGIKRKLITFILTLAKQRLSTLLPADFFVYGIVASTITDLRCTKQEQAQLSGRADRRLRPVHSWCDV